MVYRLIVHGPVPAGDEKATLRRLRAALRAGGVDVIGKVKIHDGHNGERLFHVESRLQAPSAYHAAHVTGKDIFASALGEAKLGIAEDEIVLYAERDSAGAA